MALRYARKVAAAVNGDVRSMRLLLEIARAMVRRRELLAEVTGIIADRGAGRAAAVADLGRLAAVYYPGLGRSLKSA